MSEAKNHDWQHCEQPKNCELSDIVRLELPHWMLALAQRVAMKVNAETPATEDNPALEVHEIIVLELEEVAFSWIAADEARLMRYLPDDMAEAYAHWRSDFDEDEGDELQ